MKHNDNDIHIHSQSHSHSHSESPAQSIEQQKPRVCTAAVLQNSSPRNGSFQATISDFEERLVCLSHGQRGLRSGLTVTAQLPRLEKEHEPESEFGERQGEPSLASGTRGSSPQPAESPRAIIDFIASNETCDRSDEIILASGWRLEAYRRNPVFQNAHQYGDVIFTLGRALITEVRTDARGNAFLFQRIEFAVEANPMARIAYALYKGKFLNAVSVGFVPLRWENGGPGDGWRRRYLEQELLEVSAVGIPANPDALQLGLKAGVIDRADLREVAELCTRALAGQAAATGSQPSTTIGPNDSQPFSAAPQAHTGALGPESNEAQTQLLQLARSLRHCLRR